MMGPLPTFSAVTNTPRFANSALFRRHHFLVRSLGGLPQLPHGGRMAAEATSADKPGLETEARSILRRITPPLDLARHKGQAGKIAVIGGCREYTGAPYFAAISALKIGADLSHVFCTKDAALVIKSYSPELIVHPVLEESYSIRDDEKSSVRSTVLAEARKWMERFDCLVVGPGLGRDPFLLDGLFLVTNNLDLIRGYTLAVLTPNVNEYKRLIEKVLDIHVTDQDASAELVSLSRRIGGATILRKGKADLISDGETVNIVDIFGSPRRCGGQGDILSGSVAVFSSWARQQMFGKEGSNSSSSNPMVLGCIAGSVLLRKAAYLAFADKKRATLTTDIIEFLGTSLEELCPA